MPNLGCITGRSTSVGKRLLCGDKNAGIQAAMAKLFATEAAVEIVGHWLQLLGGYGFIKDYPIERMYRDVRVFTIYEGASQIQKIIISKSMLS